MPIRLPSRIVRSLPASARRNANFRTSLTLGVAWYYAPGDDGRVDGRHVEWRDESAWRQLDAQLHAGVSTLSERSIAARRRHIDHAQTAPRILPRFTRQATARSTLTPSFAPHLHRTVVTVCRRPGEGFPSEHGSRGA